MRFRRQQSGRALWHGHVCAMPDAHQVTTSSRNVQGLAAARALVLSGEARRVRVAASLSLVAVSRTIGADPSAVGRWERGERTPRGPAALRYAQLINRLRTQLEAATGLQKHSPAEPSA